MRIEIFRLVKHFHKKFEISEKILAFSDNNDYYVTKSISMYLL